MSRNALLLAAVLAVVVIVAALVPPLDGGRADILNLLFLILLYVTLGQSWNVIGGFPGQVNLGHAAFFGIGVLAARQLWLVAHWPFPVAFVAGGVAATLFALIVGVPTFRLRGAYSRSARSASPRPYALP